MITSPTLEALQAAGQAVDNARAAFVEQTQALNERVAQAMQANPFGMENDSLYEAWKRASRISHDLQAIDTQMRALFAATMALQSAGSREPEYQSMVPLLLPASSLADQGVADVEPKKAKKVAQRKPLGDVSTRSAEKTKNVDLLVNYLKGVLNKKTPTRVTLAQMSEGTGIPSGSMHAAINAVLDDGVIVGDGAGNFKLH